MVYDIKATNKDDRRKTRGCQTLVQVCKEWKITAANLSHISCSGDERKAGIRVPLLEATSLVNGNVSIFSADSHTTTLKGQAKFGNMSAHSLRTVIRIRGCQDANETFMRVSDYVTRMKALSRGCITDCQTCAS